MRRIQQQESLFTLALYPLERALTSILEAPLTLKLLSQIHATMRQLGISSDYHPTAETMLTSLLIILLSTVAYFRYQRRRRMARDLERAQAQLTYLQEKLAAVSQKHSNKQVRIFMDGAFDMMHYGHMNAFRLGRSLGTHLVVGINSDESITECKGPPLMKDEERLTMVQACKFVDQVVPGCPYIMNKEYLDYVIDKYKIDYVIHGDDPCIVDGKDVYAAAKEAGKFQSIPRTEGVSTTDIVGRMLLMTKEHHFHSSPNGGDKNPGVTALLGQTSRFLTTSHMLRLFSAGIKAPTPGMKVVYLDGAFDMFHCGHVAILQAAKQVSSRRLSILSCRCVLEQTLIPAILII
jgi:ethanolamine-phosphate cytidylyltransferase